MFSRALTIFGHYSDIIALSWIIVYSMMTMNYLCIFMCFYICALSVIKWIITQETIQNFQIFQHGDILNIRNQPAVRCNYMYSRDQLLNIGLTVSNNSALSRLDQSVYRTVNTLNICSRVHRQRGKRGGKLKPLNKPRGPNLNNLIYPNRTNTVSCKNEKVTCATLNCRSAIRKDSFIGQILREEKIDFAVLTETWFSDHKQHQFETSDLNQYGYKISVTNRQNRIGGGIALTHRNTYTSRRISHGVTRSFEFGIWQHILKNITLHIMGVYRPPSLATNTQFISDFSEFIEGIVPQYSNLMIIGDFNLHIDDNSSTTADFKDSLFSMGLTQHVDFSTHTGGNILDLVITEATNGVYVLSCEPGTLVSDHCIVKVTLNVKKENILSKTFTF